MSFRNLILASIVLLGLTACLGRFTSSESPHYYEVDYRLSPFACESRFDKGLRLWHFSAAAPYDRDEMIVISPSRRVKLSPTYRWIALPGIMISDRLLQDLGDSGLFPRVVGTADASRPPMHLGGSIFRFAWEEHGASGRAVLDIEVRLWTEEPKSDVLFHKRYRLEGEPASEGDSERFAAEMSGLVQLLSTQLQRDLCAMLKGNLSPTGG